MKLSVIICAAGRGERAHLGKNKVLAPYEGQPVIYTVCEKFYGICDEIVICCNPADREEIISICSPFRPVIAEGGKTRFESVYNALSLVTGKLVLIHDGARPFVSRDTIKNCIECAKANRSAICAVPLTDTVAEVEKEEIYSVPDRGKYYRLQTPQAFYLSDIKSAYEKAKGDGCTYTDDSSVYLKYVGTPRLCEGSETNVKLTYKNQFDRQYPPINAICGDLKIGFGSDVHVFGGERGYCTLCGVKLQGNSLIAHSDGDVPVHALMDALLSAAGLNDIGHYFPDTDEKFLNADSMELLKKVVALLKENGWQPANISIAINAEKPKLSAHINVMREKIALACGIDISEVGISAGTGEGLGFVGNGLGISATCAALISKSGA